MLFINPSAIRKTLTIFFNLAITISFLGCKKDNSGDLIVFNGSYFPASNADLSQVQMFTVKGEVADLGKIKDYLNRRSRNGGFPYNSFFFTDSRSVAFEPEYSEIKFENNSRGTLLSAVGDKTDSIKCDVTDRNSSGFILRATDVIPARFQINSQAQYNFQESINNVKRFGNIISYDNSPGSEDIVVREYREAKSFTFKGGSIYLNYMSYNLLSNLIGNFYTFSSGILNENIYTQLSAGDTLIMQKRALLYNKK